MADDKGNLLWYNRRWFDYTGTTCQATQGRGWKDVHHPYHADRVITGMRRLWGVGEPWEETFPRGEPDALGKIEEGVG